MAGRARSSSLVRASDSLDGAQVFDEDGAHGGVVDALLDVVDEASSAVLAVVVLDLLERVLHAGNVRVHTGASVRLEARHERSRGSGTRLCARGWRTAGAGIWSGPPRAGSGSG